MEIERKKITPKQIAEIYKVSRATVQNWIEIWTEYEILFPINYNPTLMRQHNPEYYLDQVSEAIEKTKEIRLRKRG
jgi:transposase